MITNETNPQEYTDPNPVAASGIRTGTRLGCTAGEQFAVTNRSTPHSLPKSSGVPRHVTIQTEDSVRVRQMEVTKCDF